MRQIHFSAWLLAVFSAVLQIVIFPLPGLYFLSWFALAPLIIAVLRTGPASDLEINGSLKLQPASPLQAFLLAYVCGVIWYIGTCYWIYDTMHQYGGISPPVALLILVLFSLYLGLYHGLFGLLIGLLATPDRENSFQTWRPLAAAPVLWVAVELARTRVTGFPWNLLGIAQVDNPVLCRISQWTGVYGISFEIVVINVAIAASFLVSRKKRGALLTAALASAAVLQAGRLVEPPLSPTDHSAVLVQENIPVAANWTQPLFERTLHNLNDLSQQALTSAKARMKPDLIVWPESPAPFYASDPLFRNSISDLARQTNAWIVTGAIGTAPATPRGQSSQVFNSAVLIGPTGELAARYDKIHLVPFGEYLPFPSLFAFAGGLTKEVGEFTPGESRTPLNAGGSRVGTFICYESIFPDDVRRFAAQGAQAFVNISNDGWYGDSGAYAQHLNQTRMRAIENNRWILSDTNTGVTGGIDPWGRLVSQIPRKVRTTLVAPYALTSVTTFYTRHGDWFSYLCAIISAGALMWRFISRKKAEGLNDSRVRTGIRIAE
ncbi:MAG TPA: apolipoprotein N-acyltransferase [Candidatus Sulfotelmatobacter sp.]